MIDKVGKRIRSVRLAAGLSQADFGAKVGVSLPTVVRIEKGESVPRLDLILAIVQAFKCDMSWLATGEMRVAGITVLRSLEPSGKDDVIGQLVMPGLDASGVGLIVAGDDAAPTAHSGDTVIVSSDTVTSGALVAYRSRWQDVRVRRYVEKDGEKLLVAEMQGLPDIVVDAEIRIYGRVSHVVRCIAM